MVVDMSACHVTLYCPSHVDNCTPYKHTNLVYCIQNTIQIQSTVPLMGHWYYHSMPYKLSTTYSQIINKFSTEYCEPVNGR